MLPLDYDYSQNATTVNLYSKWEYQDVVISSKYLYDIADAIRTRLSMTSQLSLEQLVEYVGKNLIQFTIDRTTYQALNGMTWSEFVNSEYNVANVVIVDSNVLVLHSNHRDPIYNSGTSCGSSDVINHGDAFFILLYYVNRILCHINKKN